MVKVGHTHVHGVVERHLVPLQVGAGWGLEETERGHVYILHCSLLLDVQQLMFVNLAQDKIWEAYNRGDLYIEIEGRSRELPYLLSYQGHIRELL